MLTFFTRFSPTISRRNSTRFSLTRRAILSTTFDIIGSRPRTRNCSSSSSSSANTSSTASVSSSNTALGQGRTSLGHYENQTVLDDVKKAQRDRIPPKFPRGLDHVAIGVRDLSRSVEWYRNVLGFELFRPEDPMFHAWDSEGGIRMIANESVKVALLQIDATTKAGDLFRSALNEMDFRTPTTSTDSVCIARRVFTSRTLRGHFAMDIGTAEHFTTFRGDLLRKLRENLRIPDNIYIKPDQHLHHDLLWIEDQDYGVQKSVFFRDPDWNEVEVCYWTLDGHENE